ASPLDEGRRMSLELESVPLLDVLYMIAQQNGLNLVISGRVGGDVSVRLNDVDVETALDAVLVANGYNYFLRDDIVVVKPADEVAPGDLESRIITLRYVDPGTVQRALQSRLSDKGQVVILDKVDAAVSTGGTLYKANRVLITDYPSLIPELVDIVLQMDVSEQVVLIEARIIETTIDDNSKLGFLWPSSVSADMADATAVTTAGDTDDDTDTDGSVRKGAGAYNPNTGDWTWGTLTVNQLSLVLDLLEEDGNSRLISDPRVTTIANHEAEIRIQTVIPIQTINRFTEGAAVTDIVTFQDEEVGISLRVTPRINESGTITLDVFPSVEDIIGFSGPPDNQKPITSERSIRTTITVKEGETAALGGLLKEDEITKERRVPLLGHIPILGSLLFTNRSVEKTTSDLIILITPTILH
ncbi:hypothetical protein GF420_08980, partial [candidate division GN15 bacterium]|nr:hypothetical protein [candidate division GN15 bacterium]